MIAGCAALLAGCPASHPSPASPTCADGLQNQGESDVDCGGPCAPCADGKGCGDARDCQSGVCSAGACAAPSCADGVKNGDEAGVDCGGACPACGSGIGCTSGAECAQGVCLDGSCDCGDDSGVYVSAAGDDANPGTAAAPLKTIQAAVACAYKVPREIRVAGGLYESSRTNAIGLVEGKSLVGGWSADFSARDTAAHETRIVDTTVTSTSVTGVAVYVSSSSTATVLDGFTIEGTTLGDGSVAMAISVSPMPGDPSGATVRNNVIRCGGNSAIDFARCVDLGTSGGTLVFERNAIHLGSAHPTWGTSWGFQGYAVSNLQIVGNVIDQGSSAAVVPIELWVAASASPLVAANDVKPGSTASEGIRVLLQDPSAPATAAVRNNVVVVAGDATGIEDGSGAEISNNTVVAATGPAILTSLSGAQIRNNALVAQSGGACIAESDAAVHPYSVQHNDLWGCGKLYLDDGTTALSLAQVNDTTVLPGGAGNLSQDPLLQPANGHRPGTGSPLFGNGLDLSSSFTTDITGATRTVPWTIGAYQ